MTEPVTLPSGITLHADIAGDGARPTVIPILGTTDNITDWPLITAALIEFLNEL